MLALFRQIVAVTAYNLRNIPNRARISGMTVIGVAVTVAVLVSVLSMAAGFNRTMRNTGHADRVLVLRGGSLSESESSLAREDIVAIMNAPGIRRDARGEPIASPEAATNVSMPLRRTGTRANIILRGVGAKALQVRPEIRLVEGRLFRPGMHELIVGRAAAGRFDGLAIGSRIVHHDAEWQVTGVFESDGDAHESEMIGDVEMVLSTLRRNLFQEVVLQLESPASFATLESALKSNPALVVDVRRETDYYAEQSERVSRLLLFVGNVVGTIMALGAIFGALNTMYTAVATRTPEIGTLRALGFGGLPVVVSVVFEALLLALIGSAIGALAAWALFNGATANTLGSNFTQVVFRLSVTPAVIRSGVLWACLIGLIGGLFPAIRAARIPVVTALRAA